MRECQLDFTTCNIVDNIFNQVNFDISNAMLNNLNDFTSCYAQKTSLYIGICTIFFSLVSLIYIKLFFRMGTLH